MKKFLFAAAALVIMFAALSCTAKEQSYRTDITSGELAEKLLSYASNGSDMAELDKEFFTYYTEKAIPASADDYTVYMQVSGVNIDEIGVMKSSDPQAAKDVVQSYLKGRLDNWNPQYLQEEYPKMENADCRIFGEYVVWTILPDEEKTAVYEAAREILTVEK